MEAEGLDPDGELARACGAGDLDLCRVALAMGGHPSSRGREGMTPLMEAVVGGHLHCLAELIAALDPSELSRVDYQGWDALMHASAGGRLACLRALLAAGASCSTVGERGHTAFTLAIDAPETRRSAEAALALMPGSDLDFGTGVGRAAETLISGRNWGEDASVMLRALGAERSRREGLEIAGAVGGAETSKGQAPRL